MRPGDIKPASKDEVGKRKSNLTNAALVALIDLGQAPVSWHAPVALESAHPGPTLALSALGVAGVREAAQPVAVAEVGTTGPVGPEGRGLPVQAAAVPRVLAPQG
jgi:hypothetical protein